MHTLIYIYIYIYDTLQSMRRADQADAARVPRLQGAVVGILRQVLSPSVLIIILMIIIVLVIMTLTVIIIVSAGGHSATSALPLTQ